MNSFLSGVRGAIQEVITSQQLSDGARDLLLEPMRSIEVTIPLRMDDGSTRAIKAWRVQHNDALGPFKGGIRFAPQVDRDEVTALATTMSIKNAALKLPYGGAKGGASIDPKELSTSEIERLARGYVDAFYSVIGPSIDVPAPDVGTNALIMGYMIDEYAKLSGKTVPDAFTGKPIILGGTAMREAATGYGGYVALREILKLRAWDKSPEETTIAIQGFGNVGSHIARILAEEKFNVVAVSDSGGGLYHPEGIDIPSLLKAQEEAGKIAHNACYAKSITETSVPCEHLNHEEFLTVPVDIFVPAALEGALTSENANSVQAKIILEMANGGVEEGAEAIFEDKGIAVVPDVIANGGGVATSYLEWVENREGRRWRGDAVKSELDALMQEALHESMRYVTAGVTLRQATYQVAVARMHEAMVARGWLLSK